MCSSFYTCVHRFYTSSSWRFMSTQKNVIDVTESSASQPRWCQVPKVHGLSLEEISVILWLGCRLTLYTVVCPSEGMSSNENSWTCQKQYFSLTALGLRLWKPLFPGLSLKYHHLLFYVLDTPHPKKSWKAWRWWTSGEPKFPIGFLEDTPTRPLYHRGLPIPTRACRKH